MTKPTTPAVPAAAALPAAVSPSDDPASTPAEAIDHTDMDSPASAAAVLAFRFDTAVCSIEVTTFSEWTKVTITGDVDAAIEDELTEALYIAVDRAMPTGAPEDAGIPVVVDMTGVRFCSSMGLGLLLRHTKSLGRADISMVVATTSRAVLRPLQIMGLDHLLTITDTLPAAHTLLAIRNSTDGDTDGGIGGDPKTR